MYNIFHIKDVVFDKEQVAFDVDFHEKNVSFDVEFCEVHTVYVGAKPYTEEYIVTPKVDQQMLYTKNKLMTDDVTVKAIPYFDVENISGGSTVYIGSEI